ncbi:MAG: hypothetical protein U5K54_05240 [Cytophagales bacterium]|nr:hypothetical protein [Cytophagales bacterium]
MIGVIKNYHQFGLQQKIGSMTLDYAPGNSYLYAIKIQGSQYAAIDFCCSGIVVKKFSGL